MVINKTCSACGGGMGSNNSSTLCPKCYHVRYREEHSRDINDRVRIWKKQYRQEHRLQIKDYARYERFKLKLETIRAYGGMCECCGETEPLFLTIDHIYDDGKQDREWLRSKGVAIYRYLKREGWPKDRYRLLCFNCNTARGFWGVCPHTLQDSPAYDSILKTQASFRLWLSSQGIGRPHRRCMTEEELISIWDLSGSNMGVLTTASQLEAEYTAQSIEEGMMR